MSTSEQSSGIWSEANAHQAVLEVAEFAGFVVVSATCKREKEAESYVFHVHVEGPDQDPLIMKAERDQGDLLEKRLRSAGVTMRLHELSAPVENYRTDPRRSNNFVVSTTEFVPFPLRAENGFRDYYELGVALGGLHRVNPDLILGLPDFDILGPTRDTLEKLRRLQEADNLPRLGELVVTDRFMGNLEIMLAIGEEAQAELNELAAQGHPGFAPVHGDITPGNARVTRDGKVIIIDTGTVMRGHPISDLGRSDGQWRRMGRPPEMARLVRKGYADTVPWPIPRRQRELARQVAMARHGPTHMGRVADAALLGEPLDPFLFEQALIRVLRKRSLRRLGRQIPWKSEDKRIEEKMAQRS